MVWLKAVGFRGVILGSLFNLSHPWLPGVRVYICLAGLVEDWVSSQMCKSVVPKQTFHKVRFLSQLCVSLVRKTKWYFIPFYSLPTWIHWFWGCLVGFFPLGVTRWEADSSFRPTHHQRSYSESATSAGKLRTFISQTAGELALLFPSQELFLPPCSVCPSNFLRSLVQLPDLPIWSVLPAINLPRKVVVDSL